MHPYINNLLAGLSPGASHALADDLTLVRVPKASVFVDCGHRTAQLRC